VGIYQFQTTAELKTEERAIRMQLCRFTSAKYQLIFRLDLNTTTVPVRGNSSNRGVLAKGRPLELSREPLTAPQTGPLT